MSNQLYCLCSIIFTSSSDESGQPQISNDEIFGQYLPRFALGYKHFFKGCETDNAQQWSQCNTPTHCQSLHVCSFLAGGCKEYDKNSCSTPRVGFSAVSTTMSPLCKVRMWTCLQLSCVDSHDYHHNLRLLGVQYSYSSRKNSTGCLLLSIHWSI